MDESTYILCNLVEKYGDDDFSLWTVDISENDFKAALTDFVRVSGNDPASTMNKLPVFSESNPDNILHFIFFNSERTEIISTKVDDNADFR